ncbi:hypothetical protein F4775DRAFT_568041 [Neofusicoccum parvum]|nr:hypothetical protein F4775DRAFT_568041 [Neofusicoccum parvum]
MSSRVSVTFSLTDGEMVATNVNNTKMYIQPNATGLNDMGFTSSANSSQTTTGFLFYGKTLFWKSDSGSLETQFYAVPTTIDNVYSLTWGEDGGSMSGVVPVSLRLTEPSSGLMKLE